MLKSSATPVDKALKEILARGTRPEEGNRFHANAPEWSKPVLLTGYHTVMRLEEILTWDRVDLERSRIFLPGSLTKNGEALEVPLTPLLKGTLQKLREKGGVRRISGLVFQKDGRKLNYTNRVIQALSSGLPWWRTSWMGTA